jgi:hypothetical protein
MFVAANPHAALVNKRMNKSQQMTWSKRGANPPLQVRCALYNGILDAPIADRCACPYRRHQPRPRGRRLTSNFEMVPFPEQK